MFGRSERNSDFQLGLFVVSLRNQLFLLALLLFGSALLSSWITSFLRFAGAGRRADFHRHVSPANTPPTLLLYFI